MDKSFSGNPNMVSYSYRLCNGGESRFSIVVCPGTKVYCLRYRSSVSYADFSLGVENGTVGHSALVRKLQIPWRPNLYFGIDMNAFTHLCAEYFQQKGTPTMKRNG